MVAAGLARLTILSSIICAAVACAKSEGISNLGFGGASGALGNPDAASDGGGTGGAAQGGTDSTGGATGTGGVATGGSSGMSGAAGSGGTGPLLGFPYTPTNFDPASLSPSSGRTLLDCGESVFDSTSSTFTNWCGQTEPPVVLVSQPDGAELAVLAFQGLEVAAGATLRVIGTRPVVIAVFGDATISGTVDASADGVTPGAGGNLTCGASAGVNGTGSSSGGGGGGGGGGFGTKGGDGGYGDSSSNFGVGGAARGTETLSPLLGGCAGGTGGGCTDDGGGGGGALQIAAAGTLNIIGTVLSSGAQGVSGCGSEGGGSGGGSGGAILLEGNIVEVAAGAEVTADGGQGGDGSSGGQGGPGGTATAPAENGENEGANGGGGGGGAVGRIRVNGASSCTLSGTFSPTASSGC